MVLVVVVVLPGFEAFKQLANFSRADFNFCHIRPAGNIQRNFRQKFNRRTMPMENGLSPLPTSLTGPQTEFGNKSDFSHFQNLCRIGGTTKGWLDNCWSCRGEQYNAIRTHSWCLSVPVRLDQVTANTSRIKVWTLTSTPSSIGEIASPQFSAEQAGRYWHNDGHLGHLRSPQLSRHLRHQSFASGQAFYCTRTPSTQCWLTSHYLVSYILTLSLTFQHIDSHSWSCHTNNLTSPSPVRQERSGYSCIKMLHQHLVSMTDWSVWRS